MNRPFAFLLVLCLAATAAFAQPYAQQAGGRLAVAFEKQVLSRQSDVFFLAQTGQMKALRDALLHADEQALLTRDSHGNNILHVARNKQVFGLIWNVLEEPAREELLSQRNKSGETPLMTHIMYGHEDIFLYYFPRTQLYKQLQKTTDSLRNTGLDKQVGETKKAALIKTCSIGGQTMWQRAHSLYQATVADSHYAQHRATMKQVEEMIADAAPFLIK